MRGLENQKIISKKKGFSSSLIVSVLLILAIAVYILLKTKSQSYFGKFSTNFEQYFNIIRHSLIILIVFSITYLFLRATKRIMGNYLERIGRGKKNIKLFLTVYESFVWLLAIFLTFSLIFKEAGSLITSIGLIGFGLTLALQKPILNFVGWITIIFSRTYHIGDIISINKITGKVYDIRIMYTNLGELTPEGDPTGRAIAIPNEFVFTHAIINFNKGTNYVWDEIVLYMTYKSNWKKAIKIVEGIIQPYYDKNIKKYIKEIFGDDFKDYEKIIVRFEINEKGLTIKARYMVDFNKANEIKKELIGKILKKIKSKDIILGKVENAGN